MNAPAPGQQPRAATTAQVWPLTPPQRALWFLDNFNPDSSFYVISMGLVLRGHLDGTALFDALSDCVTRHEALRTRFLTLGGRPYQVFADDQPVDRTVTDVSGADDPLGRARACLDELSRAPFDLTAQAPIRTRLVRIAEDHHVLLLVVHHIVFDGWSTQVLLSDLGEAYRARTDGRAPQLRADGTGVGEYAARLAAQDGAGLDSEELAYWRETLDHAPRLELPADFPRPDHRTFAGSVHTFHLEAETAAAVGDIARQFGTTTFTVLATAFSRLMASLSGNHDVVIGVPLAGRTDADTLGAVGFFANTLPLRVDLSGADSFREALDRHRMVHQELLNRQHVPFAQLVEALKPKREANRNPYYDVCFQYLPAPGHGADFGGLTLESLSSERTAAQFDLSCDIQQVGDRLRVYFEYSSELFTEETIRRYADGFSGLLREVVTELAAQEPSHTPDPVAATSPGSVGESTHAGLPDIVATQAVCRPEHEAARDARQSMTFHELHAAAEHHAAVLSARGIGRHSRVGVLASPSVRQVAAMLGVMRSGALYVPLDPRLPAERLAWMAEAAGCKLVLHDGTAPDMAAALDLPVLPFEAALAAPGVLPAPASYTPDDPAYLIFTSGSTGRPKGVVVPHRAAVSLARAAADVYELTDADTVLNMASPAVDVSIEELFASWAAGASVLVRGSDISDVTGLVEEERLTVLNLPAALWHEWTRQATAGETRIPAGLRLVIAGSDRVDPARVRQWHEDVGAGVRLLNAYGVTEATVTSTWYDTAELTQDARHTPHVPIGRPLPNTVVHVLDEHGEPVPAGVPGELCIGGAGVALGYLDAPDETAARFVPDPFRPGHSMYRTGDRVRELPSGALEFRGRLDHQVKIRGTRIELAEVERVAGETPGVADFVADVRTDEHGTPRLVGYLRMAREESAASLDEVRVDEWKQVHDAEVFNEVEDGQEADLNTSGWLSSYDLQPIPEQDMVEWRDEAVSRVMELPARRVLEIGCGTGMILLAVAPHTEAYTGTDISPRALEYVDAQLPAADLDDGRVRLVEAPAHDLSAVEGEQFDLIVLNSVVQYFPTARYLDDALRQAWQLLSPGGRLVVGDVRDLTLLRPFHLSVQRCRNPQGDDLRGLLDSVEEAVENENELCLGPDWFYALGARLPEFGFADIRAKSGRADTEMNGFRFDAVLHKADGDVPARTGPRLIDGADLTLPRFGALLGEITADGLLIQGVRDARVAAHAALYEAMSGPQCASLDDGLRRAGQQLAAVHPADLAAAARQAGAAITLTAAGDGLIDVTVAPNPGPARVVPGPRDRLADVGGHANHPLDSALRRDLLRRVRERMSRQLPRPMVPSRMVFVEDFPLTVSGKVDRSRLPEPARAVRDSARRLPSTAQERALAQVWEEVLSIDALGVDDNFFEIGGDSIGWLRIVSRCSAQGVGLTARDVFQHQTIRELAAAVEQRQADPGDRVHRRGAADLGEEPAEAGLTPVQQWFFEAFPEGRDRQTQTQWFAVTEGCALPVLRQAVHDVTARHAVLGGVRFTNSPEGRRQVAVPVPSAAELVLEEVVLPGAGAGRERLLGEAAERAQNGLSVTGSPLLRAVLFRTPAGEDDLLFWCIHHLVVDAVSWQILTEDLAAALRARRAGHRPELPASGASFLRYSRWSRQTVGAVPDRERQYWHETARADELALPLRHAEGSGRYGDAHRPARRVTLAEARNRRSGERVLAGCLNALRRALVDKAGAAPESVTLEFHGRPTGEDAPEVSRTVGWFTALFPFVLRDEPVTQTAARLAQIPDGGIGYGRLRQEAEQPLTGSPGRVVVNYLAGGGEGSAAGGLHPVAAPRSPACHDVDAAAAMPFAAEVNFSLARNGTLTADLVLDDRYFDAAGAGRFADRLEAALRTAFGAPFSLLPEQTLRSSGYGSLLAALPAEDAFPLAPMQRVMLNRHLLAGSKDANYNECVLTLRGPLDGRLFRDAWRALARRFDVLRTSVEWESLPEPLQVVHREPPEAVAFLDWTALSPVQVKRRLATLLAEHRAAPPVLSGTPPYRLVLVKTAPRVGQLVWTDHHILLDGWSSSLLMVELVRAYTELAQGLEPFADEAPAVSYGTFVRWLQERPDGRARDFWREQLDGFVSPTPLPFDAPPPALSARSDDYAECETALSGDALAALRSLARRRQATLGTVLATAWAALLHRNSGADRVTFGVSLNGRPAELGDVSAMAGLYLTTLPLSVRTDAQTPLDGLLGTVAETSWQLGEVSAGEALADVYEAAGIPMSRTLFHSVLVVQNFGGQASGPAVGADTLQVESGHGRLLTGAPLTLAVVPGTGTLRLIWDERVFAAETAELILRQYTGILTEFAHHSGRRLGELPSPVFTPRPVKIGHRVPQTAAVTGALPQGDTEQRVAAVWRESLGTATVGREMNLFEAGANSMTVTRLHARLCEEFGATVSVADLFRHPTVAAQALLLGPATSSPERALGDNPAGLRGSRRRAAMARRRPQGRPGRVPAGVEPSAATDDS
ncbi:non-ribosomal peptide synthetase [Streptomyces sp. NBC_01800]|uniref:non-ribosomal peptide synthetase n=1 Tax=Streptomyces sp. NBC_01800 TaxID=2975945 RepID=UPI002DDA408B|nr:non-ribosomal peptide synthetase [Streptomyces sp. NBC_01800]WSA71463.1 amino acid adenylation domain-containing protein [Streptomyces sp. NBC_01800]